VPLAAEALQKAAALGRRLELPVDVVATDDLDNPTVIEVVSANAIPKNLMGVDIGPETVRRFLEPLREARTVVWNGPLGVFELPPFAHGTQAIATALAELSATDADVIIGGGDSAAAVEQMGLAHRMDHISTGGGASLEFLEGKVLPGVAALG
ncbi:MAG: phosphoglycerate kinase, partial [Armatimonadetes bacterium]|nr:phosphoglycerate kinase [Armatimonadota bacterium]